MTSQGPNDSAARSWFEQPLLPGWPVSRGLALFTLIVLLAVITRFVHLGQRVMSHDESLHTYYSWQFYMGRGYQHTPMMHGPLQFHLIALSYFLFGDSDFTARLPHALAGVLALAFLWAWRRYLGRWGTLFAAGLMLISPYLLYYSRYARNEAFALLAGVVTLWAMLRYLDTGRDRYLYWLTAALVLHYTAKETAFIYTAQALIFLGLGVLQKVLHPDEPWRVALRRRTFVFALLAALILTGFAVLTEVGLARLSTQGVTLTTAEGEEVRRVLGFSPYGQFFLALAALTFAAALGLLFTGYDWRRLRQHRETHLIVLQLSLVAPMLAPLLVTPFGIDALSTAWPQVGITAAAILALALLGVALVAWLWDLRRWWPQAALFWAVFVVLYTALFTNGQGFFSGLVSSLGYWLGQQDVRRGNQPWYYYLAIHIPIYEYLPALGFLAVTLGRLRAWLSGWRKGSAEAAAAAEGPAEEVSQRRVVALLWFWSLTSVLAYTLAGEKMPWLTVHITWPMILLTGWWLGRLFERLPRQRAALGRLALLLGLLVVFALAVGHGLSILLSPTPPFQGKELDQLRATGEFLLYAFTALLAGYGVVRLSAQVREQALSASVGLAVFGVLAVFTWHTAYQAAYIHYDQANEFLVYAHAAHGVRVAMDQIELIAERAYDGIDNLPVAYDDAVSWPLSWYLRHYTQQRYYGASPDRSLREVPVILVGAKNYAQIEPIVANRYIRFDYQRMVWPTEDYRGLTWERIVNALRDPAMRAALFQIWLNRDFTLYNQVTGKDLRPSNWSPSDTMRLYVRNDVAAKIWEFGTAGVTLPTEQDPFEGRRVILPVDAVVGPEVGSAGMLLSPRDVAVAPDGTLYIADTYNHRVVHWDPATHQALAVWGGTNMGPAAEPGLFNEPWGLAVAPDGSVWVADTWNHRVQKFTADGQLLRTVEAIPVEAQPAFYGPRDVAVDAAGRVYVADTGNKRIVVLDAEGRYLTHMGGGGLAPGQFEEPVGLALGPDGMLYVADTWNQRIQVLSLVDEHTLAFVREWEVPAWYGQGVENKPYLAVDAQGRVYASDPEGGQVLVFDGQGNPLFAWSQGPDGPLGVINGLDVDDQARVWVAEASRNRILAFRAVTGPATP
ncbi:MAG: TIGR03663 family protein [Chloroflexi bacterium]|nr:TIGR03663 family protein [Chloroflexota bacterium]